MIITLESQIRFVEESANVFNTILEDAIDSDSLKEDKKSTIKIIFDKIKAWIKEKINKFIVAVKEISYKLSSGANILESNYKKYRRDLDIIFDKIDRGEIDEDKLSTQKFTLFKGFDFDGNIYPSSIHNLFFTLYEMPILRYMTDESVTLDSIKERIEKNKKATNKKVVEEIIGTLSVRKDNIDDLNKIVSIVTGEPEVLSSDNIVRVVNDIEQVIRTTKNFVQKLMKTQDNIKKYYNDIINDIDTIVKEYENKNKDEFIEGRNINDVVTLYKQHIAYKQDLINKVTKIAVDIRAKQISTYISIIRFCLSFKEGVRSKNESSIFESVEFI